jgi:DNA end-binding protein Ku
VPDANDNDTPRRPRSFWSGTIAFGLVSVPVSLFVANRSSGVALHMVDHDGTPLKRRYFCSRDERLLSGDEIVRGYEIEKDRYVIVKDEELEALAPVKSREIDLKRFVPLDQIDPIYFERAYFLAPDRGASKAYRLLARTMEEVGRAGIATFVMRGKEYLVAIIGQRGLLRAETLRFRDDLRSPEDVGLPQPEKMDAARMRDIAKAIKALAADELDREALSDPYRQQLHALIERKLEAGTDVVAAPEEPESEDEGAEVIDLMQVLKQSLDQAPPAQEGRGRGKKTGAKGGALTARSKSELYARAQELGIEGRSSMTKDELVRAIRQAQ